MRRVRTGPVWAVAVGLLGSVTLGCVPAAANVRSEALYARGLIAFNIGQWEQAYRLFNEAVQADPSDAVAVYYRGLTQARRGALAPAIQDLEQALKLNPSLPHAALDLGIAYFNAGQYAAAKPWLERAHQQGSERFTAAFFLGLTLYRLGDDAGAQQYFDEAKADPELRPAAEYYAGLSMLRQGHTDAARTALGDVAREAPQTEVGKAAQGYLEGAAPVVTAGAGKPWWVSGSLRFGYDSNVVIEPSGSGALLAAQGISHEDAGFAAITAGAGYTLLDTDYGSLVGQYDFYQSVYFDLAQFDLQGHHLQLSAASKPGTVTYGIAGAYDFYLLDFQTFYQQAAGQPWVAFHEGETAATQLYYTARGQDFFRGPYDPGRDSIDNAVGVRQYLTLGSPDRLLSFGYQWDFLDTFNTSAQGKDFQYMGSLFDIGISTPLWSLATMELGYLLYLENYQYPNSRADFIFRRHDAEQQIALALLHDLTPHVALVGDFIAVINHSNIEAFDYNRYIFSLGVRVVL